MGQKITLKINTFILLLILAVVIPFFIGRMLSSNPVLLRVVGFTVGPAFVGFGAGFLGVRWMMEGRRRRRGERVRLPRRLLKEGIKVEVVGAIVGLEDGGEEQLVADSTLLPSTPAPVKETSQPSTSSSPAAMDSTASTPSPILASDEEYLNEDRQRFMALMEWHLRIRQRVLSSGNFGCR